MPVAGGQSTILFGGGHRGMGAQERLAVAGRFARDVDRATRSTAPGRPVRVNADGTERRTIRGYGSNPAGMWSPDGSRIVCLGTGHGGIIVVDIATGDASLVAEGTEAIWLDDHTLLVEV